MTSYRRKVGKYVIHVNDDAGSDYNPKTEFAITILGETMPWATWISSDTLLYQLMGRKDYPPAKWLILYLDSEQKIEAFAKNDVQYDNGRLYCPYCRSSLHVIRYKNDKWWACPKYGKKTRPCQGYMKKVNLPTVNWEDLKKYEVTWPS